ncbi:leucine--tRNA ligase [Candidatus Woesearchaeota archaeon]|jgi:leucyl-tRNA synthetase|nr:leucine--tRNA ligase [Candidatus Woesearchaeota archaeon]MBT5397154.1 leucine--tRNA ligase [Candidatus Woesearchaeota archaeon]MBT6367300.1 leucine--tRNA ligase [Candidatus Woesearchaeota archaeon]MBT7762554.1 leucine--tRNA ligase [Candidatus Woesearchaeota archaeon]
MTLDWEKIQPKWQKQWEKAEIGKASPNKNKDKFFMIFAYPGVSGFLHVGHMRGFSYTDAICRYERLLGKEVLYPVGTHASGNQAIAFAQKVKNNDEQWINYLKKNGCPEKTIKTLTTPENVIQYFNDVYVNEYWKKFGFLCDWDRFLCSTHKDYEKFIQWQFKKLQQKDLLTQKPYFATACIKCGPVAVDPSETDISKGGNAEKNEYTLLKFKHDEDYVVAATLRPETIYGQTNLWINPDAQYVRVDVEGENWIMSKDAAEKLSYQKDDVILKEDVDPRKLIGKKVIAPGIEKEIIILPAPFCNPTIGSGIVTCVPSDAPYDYVALRDLQKNTEECEKYNLNVEEIQNIAVIPIIKTKGFGNIPAQEIVQKLQIKNQDDPKLEDATKDIYKAGFHTGVMLETCGKYAGKKVEEAKELMKAELLELGKADTFYDLSEEVICRCGGKVVIKRIDDQWFITYSDPELTERSKEQVQEMKIFPQEYAEHLPGILDWFADRACARLGNWSGSTFPFDDQWTVEPISDSTLYPAYYIVSKFINNNTIKVKDLTEEFFDYIFLGEGDGNDTWNKIKEEFDYFYPLDINLGGKEHKTVHFPVFLMNHVAILPEHKWPKGIFVNWWVTGKGSKISKSKGGAVPIPEAVATYGVDAMRLYYAHVGSPHTDVVWTEDIVMNYKNALERVYGLVDELKKKTGSKRIIDNWLLSRVHQHLKETKKIMKTYDLRELASVVYFTFYDDLRWYVRRGGNNKKVITDVISIWCKLMNPITPHMSEECNMTKGLISTSSWPEYDETMIQRVSHAGEELIKKAMEGMRNVIKLAKIETPTKCTLFIAEPWLYNVFTIISHEIKVTRNVGEIIRRVLEEEKLRIKGKEISKIVGSVLKDVSKLPSMVTSQEDEHTVMKDAQEFLEKEFGCSIEIILANESDHEKAKSAMPGKVGIVIE